MNKLKEIKAIIFDKDGTLLDFDEFWVSITKAVFSKILEDYNLSKELLDGLLSKVGIKNNSALKDGIICAGTYTQVCDVLISVLKKYNNRISKTDLYVKMMEYYNDFSSAGKVVPTCEDLKETLYSLKSKGFVLAVATTDNNENTAACLNSLGILDAFDKIYTDDCGLPCKPNPEIAKEFCETYKLKPENVLMVGDTKTDLQFAASSRMKSALITSGDEPKLIGKADVTVSCISQLAGYLGDE